MLQQASIRQAEADLAAETANAGFAKEEEARYRALAQTPAGSRQNAERAQAADEAARAGVEAAAAALAAARQQLSVLNAAKISDLAANMAGPVTIHSQAASSVGAGI